MSIISAVLTPQIFTIVTDTLEALPNIDKRPASKDRLTGFKSKIFHYPHLKSSTVILGLSSVAMMHAKFINENFIKDAVHLFELTLNKFIPELNMDQFRPAPHNQTICYICIFGYSESERKLVAYEINVIKGRETTSRKLDLNPEVNNGVELIMSPTLNEEEHEKLSKSFENESFNLNDYIVEGAKIMHQNYLEHDPGKNEIPLGGELHQTMITVLDGIYMTNTAVIYRFPDYDSNAQRIEEYLLYVNKQKESIKDLQTKLNMLDEIKPKDGSINDPVGVKKHLTSLLKKDDFDMIANAFDMTTIDFNAQMLITLQNNIIKDLHAFASKLIDQAAGSDSKSPL